MTRERCDSCGRALLWSNGRLLCANSNCTTGHRGFLDTGGALDPAVSVSLPDADKAQAGCNAA